MSHANEAECEAAGLDPKTVARIAGRISRAAADARSLGLTLFGGAGSGSLRFDQQNGMGPLIVAWLDGHNFDGGDGGNGIRGEGLERGET